MDNRNSCCTMGSPMGSSMHPTMVPATVELWVLGRIFCRTHQRCCNFFFRECSKTGSPWAPKCDAPGAEGFRTSSWMTSFEKPTKIYVDKHKLLTSAIQLRKSFSVCAVLSKHAAIASEIWCPRASTRRWKRRSCQRFLGLQNHGIFYPTKSQTIYIYLYII